MASNKWGMEVITVKSKVMGFRKAGDIKKIEKWFYNDNLLEIVPI